MISPEISNPLFCHWYVGVAPPLIGVAVNVTPSPGQIAPDGLATMVTFAVKIGFTDIVIVFEVSGLPDKHGLALLVMIQVILSPLAKEDEE